MPGSKSCGARNKIQCVGTCSSISCFNGSISCVGEIVGAFVWLDCFDQSADVLPCVLDGSLLRVAHPVFDLGKGLFDRIEIWRVRRQKPEPCTGGFDALADGR